MPGVPLGRLPVLTPEAHGYSEASLLWGWTEGPTGPGAGDRNPLGFVQSKIRTPTERALVLLWAQDGASGVWGDACPTARGRVQGVESASSLRGQPRPSGVVEGVDRWDRAVEEGQASGRS